VHDGANTAELDMSGRNSFTWARRGLTKDLILREGPRHLEGRRVRRILDVGSAASEEIVALCPDAEEFLFLDSFVWPPVRPGYTLLRQGVGAPWPIESASLDVVSTNGSFDHFSQPERHRAFLEIERCLRPGGVLLFACEYFDFDPGREAAFFAEYSASEAMQAINCTAGSNIDLRSILRDLTALQIRQVDLSVIPDGRPLRAFVGRDEATYFRPHDDVVDATYGSFFVVFDRR
jgi:SAM-dependent methyltransferase